MLHMQLDPTNGREVDKLKELLQRRYTVRVTLTSQPGDDSDYAIYLRRGSIEKPEKGEKVPFGNGAAVGSQAQTWRGGHIVACE